MNIMKQWKKSNELNMINCDSLIALNIQIDVLLTLDLAEPQIVTSLFYEYWNKDIKTQ